MYDYDVKDNRYTSHRRKKIVSADSLAIKSPPKVYTAS